MREIITEEKIRETQPKMKTGERLEPKSEKVDDYPIRIIKLIPAEVLTLYIALTGIIVVGRDSVNYEVLYWIIFIICLVGTPLYLKEITNVNDNLQIGISTLSFIVWVFAIGGPFTTLTYYQPVYGALLLPIFTFFIPMILPK